MTLLARWDAWLRRLPAPVFLLLLLAALVVHTGIWVMPNYGDTARRAMDPFTNPFAPGEHEKDYLLSTWFVWFVAWLIGVTGERETVVFTLAVALAFLAVTVAVIRVKVPPGQRRLAWLIFFLLPAAGVPLYWVGADSMTLLLMVLAVALVDRPRAAVAPGFLLGMQHVEQAMVAVVGVGVLAVLRAALGGHRRPVGRFALWWGLGIIAGRFVLTTIWTAFGMAPEASRLSLAGDDLAGLVGQFLSSPAAILWSGLGVVWLVVAMLFHGAWRTYAPLVVASLVMLSGVALVEDQTRIFAIVSLPVVMIGLVLDEAALRDLPERALGALAFVGFLVPWIWVWKGYMFGSLFPQDIAWLVHQLTGRGSVPLPFLRYLL